MQTELSSTYQSQYLIGDLSVYQIVALGATGRMLLDPSLTHKLSQIRWLKLHGHQQLKLLIIRCVVQEVANELMGLF